MTNAIDDAGTAKNSAYSCHSESVLAPSWTDQMRVPQVSSNVPNTLTTV